MLVFFSIDIVLRLHVVVTSVVSHTLIEFILQQNYIWYKVNELAKNRIGFNIGL